MPGLPPPLPGARRSRCHPSCLQAHAGAPAAVGGASKEQEGQQLIKGYGGFMAPGIPGEVRMLDTGGKPQTAAELQARKELLYETSHREGWAIRREDVEFLRPLSETIKSKVWLAKWKGVRIAAKFTKVEAMECEEETDKTAITHELLHEVELMAKMRHPDLVLFLGAELNGPEICFSEFMEGGDLQRYYMRKRAQGGGHYVPARQQVIRWASALARVLSFLHGFSPKIIHRDLKPLNLFLTKDCKDIKLADFGTGKVTQEKKSATFGYRMTGGIGSWRYMAPEVARHHDYDEKVDIFSFGLILYFMSAGREPFYERPEEDWMLQEYIHGREPRPQVKECHKALRDIMMLAWHMDSQKRPDAADIVEILENIKPQRCAGCAMS